MLHREAEILEDVGGLSEEEDLSEVVTLETTAMIEEGLNEGTHPPEEVVVVVVAEVVVAVAEVVVAVEDVNNGNEN